MRSLLLLEAAAQDVILPSTTNSKITAITTDPSTDGLYVVAETARPDGKAELAIFSLPSVGHSGEVRSKLRGKEGAAQLKTVFSLDPNPHLDLDDRLALVLFAPGSVLRRFVQVPA
jgi:hypothetical protein